MPVLTHRKPKYRRHASGQGVVTLAGRDIYLGCYGTPASRAKYRRLIQEWESNNRSLPASAVADDYSIAELIAGYWNHARGYFAVENGKSDGELKNIRGALSALNKLYADTDVREFGPLALRAVRDSMLKLDWSRTYINAQVNRIRRAFKWGVEHELVGSEIWHALQAVASLKSGKTSARENEPITTVDDCYVQAVLPWLNRHVCSLVQLQQITGARPGELILLRGVDISMKNPKLWEFRPVDHKTKNRGHERIIYLNADAQSLLKPFITSDVAKYIFSPIDAEEERRKSASAARKTPLSCGNVPGSVCTRRPRRPPGDHYSADSYRRAITRACDLADRWARGGRVAADDERLIPRWHPHQIRHNTATKLRAEYGLEAAQAILGHRTLSATQIYAEKNVEKAKQIMMQRARS